ncbi:MAG: RsmD family RNA methyltransferase [Actinomycetota bacterium]
MAVSFVRVIAGQAKGRTLKLDHRAGVRPTSDRLKEALFSTVGSKVQGAFVLDLYAGSGALGIEALSRGAAHATFVDGARPAIAMIRANLAATGFDELARVIHATAEDFALVGAPGPGLIGPPAPGPSGQAGGRFDLVLMDPPYAVGLPGAVLERLHRMGWLAKEALLVAEVSSRLSPVAPPAGLTIRSQRRYGDSLLLYLTADTGG